MAFLKYQGAMRIQTVYMVNVQVSVVANSLAGWISVKKPSKTPANVDSPLPSDSSAELLEHKNKVSEAMLLVYMCKNDVGELVMANNTAIEEVAVMKMQVVASVLEVAEMRRDMSDAMEKTTELMEKPIELKVI